MGKNLKNKIANFMSKDFIITSSKELKEILSSFSGRMTLNPVKFYNEYMRKKISNHQFSEDRKKQMGEAWKVMEKIKKENDMKNGRKSKKKINLFNWMKQARKMFNH